MAQGKASEKIMRLRCSVCKHVNYTTSKNRKTVERKLEFKKFCNWCRKRTTHKEAKK